MYSKDEHIEGFDNEIFDALLKEEVRQENNIDLIASENYCSPKVIEALGTVLTNKYAEGYPGKRYYGGCVYVDVIERIAVERAKKLFGADYANVQPHSGSQANAAVYLALLKPGDTILGMRLSHGGHLTHGAKVSSSGSLYNAVQYGLTKDGFIDYDEIEHLAHEHKPRLIVAGFSAYSRLLDFARLRRIANAVDAWLMIDMAHVAGLIATGHYPSPFPYADVVTSTTHKTLRGPRGGLILAGPNIEIQKKLNSAVFPGTQGGPMMNVIAAKAVCFLEALQPSFKTYQQQVVDNAQTMANVFLERGYEVISNGTSNHLLLISLTNKRLTGKTAEELLARANITVNKNSIPNDPQSPMITSGIRIGTPAITTRGLGIDECELLANAICDILDQPGVMTAVQQAFHIVSHLCMNYPVYIRN